MILSLLYTIIAVVITLVITIIATMNTSLEVTGGSDRSLIEDRSTGRTFMIFGMLGGFDRAILVRVFEEHGLTLIEPTSARRNVTAHVVWTSHNPDMRFDPRSYTIKCRVKNVLDSRTHGIITDKRSLHKAMAQFEPDIYAKHLARTWDLAEFTFPDASASSLCRKFIARPSGSAFSSGKGITRITSQQELDIAREEYKKQGIYNNTRIIVSEYFDDPYLFKGAKFHLRMFFMVRVSSKITWELWGASEVDDAILRMNATRHEAQDDPGRPRPRGKILTAGRPFVHANYDDPLIHDSHAKTTTEVIFFPTHASEIKSPRDRATAGANAIDLADIYAQMREICDALGRLLKRNGIRKYEESDSGFEIFGLDIMIIAHPDDPESARVVLIEANDRVGYTTPKGYWSDMLQNDYFEWAWRTAIEPAIK